MRAAPLREDLRKSSHWVEIWLTQHARDALAAYAERIDSSMRGIVRAWLRPHLLRALATSPGDRPETIPADIDVGRQRPHWVRLRVALSLREYQALRFAAARANTSNTRLLSTWLQPHLAAVTGHE